MLNLPIELEHGCSYILSIELCCAVLQLLDNVLDHCSSGSVENKGKDVCNTENNWLCQIWLNCATKQFYLLVLRDV